MLSLAQSYLNQGRTIYMDNWYTSISSAQELLHHNITCTGTIRRNRRGLPSDVTKSKLKKGQAIGLENADGV